MASRSKSRRATSITDTILGEAVSGTVEQRYNDMLHIASVIVNRARQTGVKIEDVLTQRQFNAYGKTLPKGVNRFRSLAEKAVKQVLQNGPVTTATFYATPNATKNLPKGLQAIDETFGHKYFTDPKNRAIETRFGHKSVSRAMATPQTAPVPSARPGGLGALRQAATGITATPALAPSDDSQAIAQQAMERSWAGQTLADMRTGQNMPVDPRHASIADFASIEKPAAPIPGAPNLGETITARPGSLRAPQREGSLGSLLSSFPGRPPGPVGAMPARSMPTPTPRPDYAPAPPSSFPGRPPGPVGALPAAALRQAATGLTTASPLRQAATGLTTSPSIPTPTARPDYASPQQRMAPSVSDVMRSPVSPAGPYAVATGPVAAPTALRQAATGLTTTPALRQAATGLTVATPGTTPTPATAPVPTARPAPATVLNPDRVKDDVVASTPAAAAQRLSETPAPAPAGTPAQAAVRAQAATRPASVADPWGGVRAAPVDSATPQAVDPSHPKGFWGGLGDALQRNVPAIAGGLALGPLGYWGGSLLGRAFDNAQPGQLLGNPFQGLGGSLKALGMFQSAAPYAGPRTTYGYGTRAIGDVLAGGAPVGATAYSRSTPGYSVTTLPSGVIAKTNQYGYTSYENPGALAGPGIFSGGGFNWGGGARKSEKTEKSGGGFSGGGRSSGGGATGHSKSSRY